MLRILVLLAALIPPLDAGERGRIETAVDGRDHREEAFVAMVEHVRRWAPGPHDAAIRIEPDPAALVADPDASRGDLCRLRGRIAQRTALARPVGGVEEWFVRDASDRPMVVYVVDLDPQFAAREGDAIEIDARFLKRMDFTARDGDPRSYAAFVGRFPVRRAAPGTWVLAVPVAIMLITFVGLLVYARAGRRPSRSHRGAGASPVEVDDDGRLPDDPVDALAELRRRADRTES